MPAQITPNRSRPACFQFEVKRFYEFPKNTSKHCRKKIRQACKDQTACKSQTKFSKGNIVCRPEFLVLVYWKPRYPKNQDADGGFIQKPAGSLQPFMTAQSSESYLTR